MTGADSGIGRAAAIAFAREGADVDLSFEEGEMPDAQEVARLIEAEGRKAVMLPGDITNRAFCETLVHKAVVELGGLDILVNNAGKQTKQKDIADITDEQFDLTLKTNLYAMFWITKAAMPLLPAGASIINTASVVAYNPPQILVDYAITTKAGIVAFSKALAKQAISKGIRVNVVAPGPFWTALQRPAASRRRRSRSSARRSRWAVRGSRSSSPRSMCCWPPRRRASSPARSTAPRAATGPHRLARSRMGTGGRDERRP